MVGEWFLVLMGTFYTKTGGSVWQLFKPPVYWETLQGTSQSEGRAILSMVEEGARQTAISPDQIINCLMQFMDLLRCARSWKLYSKV